MQTVDLIVHSARQLVTCAGGWQPKRGAAMRDVELIEDGAVALRDGEIVAVGKTHNLRAQYQPQQEIDASGKVVCPGFVDCHTHLVYAGDRVGEFEQRIGGAAYLDILAAGGGINSTVRATRAASFEDLLLQSRARLDAMLRLGTTTVEIKSGYGLDTDTELKMLRVIDALAQTHVADIAPTFLGAHAIPPEYKDRTDAYVDLVVDEMTPAVANWYQTSTFAARQIPLFVDVFCEQNAFDVAQSRRVLEAGVAAGMWVKAHVDEFNSLGGLALALELGAASVDHLDVTPLKDILTLKASPAVAVIMPAVNFHLGSRHYADVRSMLDQGAAVALATDLNPGSAPCYSLPLVMGIACRQQQILPAEALNACTINAAYAIGMGDKVGSLEVGKQADLLIVDAPDYRHLSYYMGVNLVEQVIKKGKVVVN